MRTALRGCVLALAVVLSAARSVRDANGALLAGEQRVSSAETFQFPPTYYINLADDTENKARMEDELKDLTSKVWRVEAVNTDAVMGCLDDGTCAHDPEAKVLGKDFMNDDGLLFYQLAERNVYSPAELACTFSHVRAIHRAYVNGEQLALILEDDVSFEDKDHWPKNLDKLIDSAPEKWGILQLWTNNPKVYSDVQPCDADDFVPWKDDHWSTMAYLINRQGMREVLDSVAGWDASSYFGNLPLPLVADHLLFNVTKTYTRQKPLFRALFHESTIQPSEGIDPTKARVEEGRDIHYETDGKTNEAIESFWTRKGECATVSLWEDDDSSVGDDDDSSELRIAIIASATANDKFIHKENIDKLATMEGGRLVMYVISEMNNENEQWDDFVTHADEIGVPVLVKKSGRDLERGFESKLVGQMAHLDKIREHAPFDYLFAIDGDLSFVDMDTTQLIATLRDSRPLIAQPTIKMQSGMDANRKYEWGSQYFRLLNADYFSEKCQSSTAVVDAPMIESQATMLSAEFLDFYNATLKQIAKFQHRMQCDWGHDEMWCSAASRLSATLSHRPPACLVLGNNSLVHWDSKAISKNDKFDRDCSTLVKNLVADVAMAKAALSGDTHDTGKMHDKDEMAAADDASSDVGPNTLINNEALLDYSSDSCINLWAQMNQDGCQAPSTDQTSAEAYKSFTDSYECKEWMSRWSKQNKEFMSRWGKRNAYIRANISPQSSG